MGTTLVMTVVSKQQTNPYASKLPGGPHPGVGVTMLFVVLVVAARQRAERIPHMTHAIPAESPRHIQ